MTIDDRITYHNCRSGDSYGTVLVRFIDKNRQLKEGIFEWDSISVNECEALSNAIKFLDNCISHD